MTPPRSIPTRRTTRTARDIMPRIPTRRAGPIGGQPSGPPADNDTGLPKTPSGATAPDAHSDTDTMAWNEEWDDSSKPKKTPEDADSKTLHENAEGKPQLMPDLDESTKITQSASIDRLDDPPSPADVPEDMRFDPEGEGTPGLMPPIPAPVPGMDDDDKGSDQS